MGVPGLDLVRREAFAVSTRAKTLAEVQKSNGDFVRRITAKQKAAVAAEKATDKPQHIVALQAANRIRLKRAADKRDIAVLPRVEAYGLIADILENPPTYWEGGSPMDLLMAVKRHGRYYSLSWLRHAAIPEARKIGELTERQRFGLAAILRDSDGRRVAA